MSGALKCQLFTPATLGAQKEHKKRRIKIDAIETNIETSKTAKKALSPLLELTWPSLMSKKRGIMIKIKIAQTKDMILVWLSVITIKNKAIIPTTTQNF